MIGIDRCRQVPRPVWGLTALFVLVLAGWSVLTPLGRAPDEPAHADLIFHLATGAPYPEFDERTTSAGTLAPSLTYAPRLLGGDSPRWLTPGSAPPRSDRKTFQEWGGDEAGGFPNQMPQHPPTYYVAMASALRVERILVPGPTPLDREWHLLRFLNLALVAPLPLLCWATARRMGAGDTAATGAAVVPLAIPQVAHIGAVINNDNLVVLLGAVLALLLAGVIRGDDRLRQALWVGVVAGVALSTKATAVAYLPWIALAYASLARGRRATWGRTARSGAAAMVVASVLGGWWPVRNLVRHGEPFPALGAVSDAPGFHLDVLRFGRTFASSLIHRFWGNFGWYEAPLDPVVVVAATVAAALVVATALWPSGHDAARRREPSRRTLAVFAAVFPLLVALVATRAFLLHRTSGQFPFIQGRYLFGAMAPLAVVVGVGVTRLVGRRGPLLILLVGALLGTDALRVSLRTWWAEPGASTKRSLAAMAAWSPTPTAAVEGLGLAVVLVGLGVAWSLARLPPRAARRTEGTPGSATGGQP